MAKADDRSHADLAWRVEEACLNAFPAVRTVLVSGWMLRLSGGRARRTNSVNPPRCGGPPEPVIAEAARLYRRAQLPVIFRVPSICDGLEAALDAQGFSPPEAETRALFAPSSGRAGAAFADARLAEQPDPDWLTASARLHNYNLKETDIYRQILALIATPARYAAISVNGTIESIAYGAVCRNLLVVESVATSPSYRGQGMAFRNIAALMTWGTSLGASSACLQVMAQNTPAVALYRRLGFSEDLYGYHYRRAL